MIVSITRKHNLECKRRTDLGIRHHGDPINCECECDCH